MKKSLWLLAIIGILVPSSLSANANLTAAVSRRVAQQQMQRDPRYEKLQQQLINFRELVGTIQEEDVSVVMQGVLELADAFFDYAAQNPELKSQEFQFRKGINIKKIVREIDTPMEVGWCRTEVFVVSYAIERFLEDGLCTWTGEQEKNELALFKQVLETYSKADVDNNPIIKLFVSNLR